ILSGAYHQSETGTRVLVKRIVDSKPLLVIEPAVLEVFDHADDLVDRRWTQLGSPNCFPIGSSPAKYFVQPLLVVAHPRSPSAARRPGSSSVPFPSPP